MKKGIVIKKGIIIALSVIAAAGVGYFVYRKISDMNKEIIEDGTFTIKVDDTASTGAPTAEDFAEQEAEDIALDDSYYEAYESYDDEAPSWSYSYDYGYN